MRHKAHIGHNDVSKKTAPVRKYQRERKVYNSLIYNSIDIFHEWVLIEIFTEYIIQTLLNLQKYARHFHLRFKFL